LAIVVVLALLLGGSAPAGAFPYLVRAGESVAAIAERVYGRVELERIVVQANALGGGRAGGVVPGMRLELPAVGYHQVAPGDSWQSIAAERLGDKRRADVLAQINDSHPWLRPDVGREVLLPYNLRYVADRGDTTESVAYRLRGRRNDAWLIASYNGLRRATLQPGQVILVPITDVALTAEGKRAARTADELVRNQSGGAARALQQQAGKTLGEMARQVHQGRYLEAVISGATLLAKGGLSDPQQATVYRLLTVAYVALDAGGLAASACARWRRLEPEAALNPVDQSPKILAACVGDTAHPADLGSRDGGGPP